MLSPFPNTPPRPPGCHACAQKPTPKEQLRSSQRDISRNVRDLERELATLKREEQKLVKVG